MQYKTNFTKRLADSFTPVSLYAKLRDVYSPCLLLESSDYHTKEDSYSIICCDVLEEFEVNAPDIHAPEALSSFIKNIQTQSNSTIANRFNSVFGFTTFEGVQCFDTLQFREKEKVDLPLLKYQFFRFIVVFEHFTDTLFIIENQPRNKECEIDTLLSIIDSKKAIFSYNFQKIGDRQQNMTDEDYAYMVEQGKHYCQIGDVFQVVPSRKFKQAYKGDNFLVYRTLRSINPSPFSFYFDYGKYQIFGASPEAQLLVRNNEAEIHPIAGTFKRSGNDDEDAKEAARLFKDPKENAEHVMLVDLARNDLSKCSDNVHVANFREIQFYSHVIHLVSKVKGQLTAKHDSRRLYADTFPAGTLSGAPKFRAMQIIDQLEPTERGIYGGAIGAFGLNGDVNHSIAIRTFFADDDALYYQAGGGIVIDSVVEHEVQEVYHKLRALETAMNKAEELSEI